MIDNELMDKRPGIEEHLDSVRREFSKQVKQALRLVPGTTESIQALAECVGYEVGRINTVLGRDRRREGGVFFSGERWADLLTDNSEQHVYRRAIDPSCGTGDLLISVARRQAGLHQSTVPPVQLRLAGLELERAFSAIARSRMKALNAFLSVHNAGLKFTSHIRSVDSLSIRWGLRDGDLVLMNPPYHRQIAPKWSTLSQSTVSSAAIFVEEALRQMPIDTGLVALVPDVIRSGSSYRRLRQLISDTSSVLAFDPIGRFSNEANVDVAVLSIRKGAGTFMAAPTHQALPTVGSSFDVRVGPVVPHRSRSGGRPLPFAHAGSIKAWEVLEQPGEEASYACSPIDGPVVLIRRTSSPSDAIRARASVVTSKLPIHVENHLIVCRPHSGGVTQCVALMENLRDPRTTALLNRVIRCRHLTTSSIASLPIWESE